MTDCPVCHEPSQRLAPADPVVHRRCGREIGSLWTFCRPCGRYTHHNHYGTKLSVPGAPHEISVCETCGEARRI